MSERLYPREPKVKDKSGRRFHVFYDLAYDMGGGGKWTGYYRTRLGAKIAAWWNVHLLSWGGTADLDDTRLALIKGEEQ